MGPKLDLAWMESRQTYRDKMFSLADRTLRGPGSPTVQDGADDFASHRLGRDRDLVVWPEDIGLFAALTGERGAPARASGSLEGAIVALIGLYGPQSQYYAERYPALAERVPQTRLLSLSLTDTFGRVVIETFAEMADRYDVWLHAGVNMAQDWQVVCASKATRPDCAEENPDKVERLRDPFEPGRDYAYEATTDRPSNMALVFAPDGRIVSKQVKTYLTPIELMGQLDLVPGAVSGGLSAVRTPVGTLGFVTSKDAWMPDVVQKLDQAGVDVLVQPEFFVNDTVCSEGCPDMWSPDTLLASGYSAMVRHPSITSLVLPELVGNVFDYSADAQQHIAVEHPRRGGNGSLIGQPPSRGLSLVMPWAIDDDATLPFPERRARLRGAGDALKPGSGVACPDPRKPGPCENGHPEGVLWRDIEVDRRPAFRRFRGARSRTPFSRARPLTRGTRAQRNAAVARHGRNVVVAYEEADRVRVVFSRDGGRTWSRPIPAPAPAVTAPPAPAATTAQQWWPAVAAGRGGRVTLAWVERAAGASPRILIAQSRIGRRAFGPPRRLAESGAVQWKPALAQGRGETVHAAFLDERARSADDDLPQAGVWYTRIDRGDPGEPQRLDSAEPGPQADQVNGEKLNNAWAPSISARLNRVLVTWLDFRDYDWDVYSRLSRDQGGSFGDERLVNDTPPADEALNDTPRAALGAGRAFVAWTDWRKRASAKDQPHQQYDIALAEPGEDNVRVDPHGGAQVSSFAPDICADGRDRAIVAWQDAAKGVNEIRIAVMAGGARRGPSRLVNDAPWAGSAWRPQLGCWGDDVTAVWEDERDGPPRLYTAFANARRLR